MSNSILFSVNKKGVAKITLNRPEVHNAFDDAFINDFLDILQTIEKNSDVKVVILEAAGKSFSAGADLKWMKRMASYTYEENMKDALALSELMHTLKFLKQPTIARIQGIAMGGGVGLIACCDIAIMSETAYFCLSEVKIGLIPAVISPYVISIIGERAARRYFLTAENISSEEALRLNLVSQVVPSQNLDEKINQQVENILRNSPEAIIMAKKLINRVSVNPYSKEHVEENAKIIASMRVSKQGQEGLRAFLEKRQPIW